MFHIVALGHPDSSVCLGNNIPANDGILGLDAQDNLKSSHSRSFVCIVHIGQFPKYILHVKSIRLGSRSKGGRDHEGNQNEA